MGEYQRSLKSIASLHQHIKDDNITDVNRIVEHFRRKHPQLIHACDEKGNSAAFIALSYNKFHIYEILIANGFSLEPTESIKVLWEKICESRGIVDKDEALKLKKSLRLIHLSYFKSASHRHLNILSAKSKLSLNSDEQRRDYRELIDRAFEDLNEIEDIVPLLKLAASSECLEIIFDFRKRSVEHMDPTATTGTLGTTYPSGTIYIGAEELLDDSTTKNEVLGVLAHELCHYAMKLVYNNSCKPYAQNSARKRKFRAINKFCKTYQNSEDIISRVYNCGYPVKVYHAELITRVPHLMAFYKSSQKVLEDRRQQFSKLFNYYSSTVVDMKLKLERDEALAIKHRLNVVCGVLTCSENPEIYNTPEDSEALKLYLSKVDLPLLNVATNCTALTMISIYKKLKSTDEFYSFTNLEHFEEYETNDVESLLKLFDQLIIVIDCVGHEQHKIEEIVVKLRKSNVNRVILVTNHAISLVGCFEVKHPPWLQR